MTLFVLWSQAAPVITTDNITWMFRLVIMLLVAVTAFFLKRAATVQDSCITDLAELAKDLLELKADHDKRLSLHELLLTQHAASIERMELSQIVRTRLASDESGGTRS